MACRPRNGAPSRRKARNSGKTAAEYVRALIERDLLGDNSFDEILRPIREDFRKSGVTSEHLERNDPTGTPFGAIQNTSSAPMSDPAARPRTVLDCNSLVQAVAFSDSPAAACLALAEAGTIELFVTRSTLQELRRVLTYDEILAISPNMTPVRIAAFLQRLAFRATLIRRVRACHRLSTRSCR